MIQGMIGRTPAGDPYPVRLMGVINLSQDSFYKGSVASLRDALSLARTMQKEGADLIDLGAVSTAPGSPPVSESEERERLFPALKSILENQDVDVSVDTQRSSIAKEALSLGAACINDVSGLHDPEMAETVADHDGSLIIMASLHRPGDLLTLSEIIPLLGLRVRAAVEAGVPLKKISVDPGVGKWIPEKTPAHDLAIVEGFGRLRCLGVTRQEVFFLVIGEAALVGVLGSGLGIGLGILLGQGAVRVVTQTINDLFFVLNVRGVQIPLLSLQ